jgi:hypothetical protein
MRSSHTAAVVSAVFDDANLVGYGGLEPVVRLAERVGWRAWSASMCGSRVRSTAAGPIRRRRC